MRWKPYDPSWIIDVAKYQYPHEAWLVPALTECTAYTEESKAYYYFVDPEHPNQAGSSWQYSRTLLLQHPKEGTIILDILTDNRIGGIEFLKKL